MEGKGPRKLFFREILFEFCKETLRLAVLRDGLDGSSFFRRRLRFLENGLGVLGKTSFTEVTKNRALGTEGDVIIGGQWSGKVHGTVVDFDQTLSCEIFDPVLIGVEENLNVLIEDCRVVEHEIAFRVPSQDNGQRFVRPDGGAVLNDQRRSSLLNDDLGFLNRRLNRWGRSEDLSCWFSSNRRRLRKAGGLRRWSDGLWGRNTRRRKRRGIFLDLGQEADLRSSVGKHQHIAVFEILLLDALAVDEGAVCTVVNHTELIPFPDDFGMFPGNAGVIRRENKVV